MSEKQKKEEKNWRILKPDDWEKQTRRLPVHLLEKLKAIVDELAELEDPTIFGVLEKNLRYGSAYVLRLDKSYRLSYRVDFKSHTIILGRVGDHKAVGSKE